MPCAGFSTSRFQGGQACGSNVKYLPPCARRGEGGSKAGQACGWNAKRLRPWPACGAASQDSM
jgi:hypothetical protein